MSSRDRVNKYCTVKLELFELLAAKKKKFHTPLGTFEGMRGLCMRNKYFTHIIEEIRAISQHTTIDSLDTRNICNDIYELERLKRIFKPLRDPQRYSLRDLSFSCLLECPASDARRMTYAIFSLNHAVLLHIRYPSETIAQVIAKRPRGTNLADVGRPRGTNLADFVRTETAERQNAIELILADCLPKYVARFVVYYADWL